MNWNVLKSIFKRDFVSYFSSPTGYVFICVFVVLGALAIRAKALPVGLSAGLIALSGVFHGYAYGEAIVGAEAAPLTAYFIGLVGIQYAIAASVIWIVSRKAAAAGFSVPARVAGGVVLGIGLVFFIQNVTSAVA